MNIIYAYWPLVVVIGTFLVSWGALSNRINSIELVHTNEKTHLASQRISDRLEIETSRLELKHQLESRLGRIEDKLDRLIERKV